MTDKNSLDENDSIAERGSEKGGSTFKQDDKNNSQRPETEKGGSHMG